MKRTFVSFGKKINLLLILISSCVNLNTVHSVHTRGIHNFQSTKTNEGYRAKNSPHPPSLTLKRLANIFSWSVEEFSLFLGPWLNFKLRDPLSHKIHLLINGSFFRSNFVSCLRYLFRWLVKLTSFIA